MTPPIARDVTPHRVEPAGERVPPEDTGHGPRAREPNLQQHPIRRKIPVFDKWGDLQFRLELSVLSFLC